MNNELEIIIKKYQSSFSEKVYIEENEERDLLMDLFNISPEIKRENRQYWGRELGMLFELLTCKIFESVKGYSPKERFGNDAPFDFILNDMAIDTKYRIGSGDAGTLKKFKKYASDLASKGYTPVILLFRTDNLPAAITACIHGGWKIIQGEQCLQFIKENSGFDLKEFLKSNKGKFKLKNRE